MYSIGDFAALISEEQNWRKLIMKNLMRMLVLTVVMSAAGFAQSISFSGPGTPPEFPPVSIR
jgi:hypothetical protein